MVRSAFKYRLYPTVAQTAFLNGQLLEACSLYNAALEERIGAWKICRKTITMYDQFGQLPPMRADGCLTLVNAQSGQDVLRRVALAFKGFFGRVKRGEKPGFPRFRSSSRYGSITFPHYGNGCRLLDSGKLRVQGAGHIKVKLDRPLDGTVKTTTIKREADRWFVVFCVERDVTPLPVSTEETGIDLGLATFAVLSNGEKIENPRHYRRAQAKLRRAERKLARRKRGSNRRRKAALLLQRTHVHIRSQRADFQHKQSRTLINRFGVIAVEDMNFQALASGLNAKSVRDAAWSQFLRFLTYKAEWAGRRIIRVDPRGTSQTCLCGAHVPKSLDNRRHDCHACGLSASRDHVSAQLILQRAWYRPSVANVCP